MTFNGMSKHVAKYIIKKPTRFDLSFKFNNESTKQNVSQYTILIFMNTYWYKIPIDPQTGPCNPSSRAW